MKTYKYFLTGGLILLGLSSFSQVDKPPSKDTSLTIKVHGVCIQCKERIEKAAKGKGVKSAKWDIDSKQLSLVYDLSLVSLDKIENRIIAVGHDLENKKAKNSVYKGLPSCCHYREIDAVMKEDNADTMQAKQTDSSVVRTNTIVAVNIQ